MCLALFTAPIELELRQKMGEYKGTNVLAKMLHFTLNSAIIDEIELYRKYRIKSQPIILLGKKHKIHWNKHIPEREKPFIMLSEALCCLIAILGCIGRTIYGIHCDA